MKITEKLTIDLNDEMFSEDFYMTTDTSRYPRLSDFKFSNKTRDEIITEVANRTKRFFR